VNARSLGDSGIELSTLGLGTWAVGAGSGGSTCLGPQDDRDSIAAIYRALDHGIDWIDTAASYGIGHAERVVARALRGMRERPYVFTKCGTIYDPDGTERRCLEASSVRAEVDGSLARLEVESLDLVHVHGPRPDQLEEGWTTLAQLQREGKVRHLGASNFSVEQLAAVEQLAPVAAVQPKLSLLDRDAALDVVPYCARRGIGVLVYSTLQHGLLTGAMTAARIAALPTSDWRRTHPDFTEPRLSRNHALVATLVRVAERHGRGPAEVAIAWALRHAGVTGAIVGGRRPEQVDGVVGAAALELSETDVTELDAHIPDPTPEEQQ
jgi:aryl-alcohol dehydrogenase-like predicted oxidoreductase